MSNKNLNLAKKLGTLLVVGLILVSHSPVTALAADDITLPENPTPTVESAVINNDQTPVVAPTTEVEVIEVTTEPSANTDTPVVEPAPVEVTTEVTTDVVADPVVETPVVESPAPEAKMVEVMLPMANITVDNSFAISEEIGGNSLPASTNSNPLVVSPEIGGQTGTNSNDNGQGTFTTLPTGGCTSNCGGGGSTNGGQGTFTTLPTNTSTNTTSGEGHFTTSTSGGGCNSGCGGGSTQTTSDQGTFTTLSNGSTAPTSAEGSFTTQANGGGGGGGGGCSSDCGGGSSGGGYSLGGGSSSSGPALPLPCELYLKKFIRLGYANDPFEVTKLEVFLNSFEGFNLPVNGIYEQRDFDAVSIFQKRYFGAVLTPWGITDSTGYVYITTTLTINQIYCQHTVGNDLDLSHIYPVYGGVGNNGAPAVTGLEATTTPTTTPSIKDLPNLLQAAAVGALNFIKDWWCLIIIILLILIIAYLLDERERLARKLKESKAALNDVAHGATPIAMLLPKEGEEEWIALDKTEPDVDPGQEPLTKL